jgi:uncharacterized membrane protein
MKKKTRLKNLVESSNFILHIPLLFHTLSNGVGPGEIFGTLFNIFMMKITQTLIFDTYALSISNK